MSNDSTKEISFWRKTEEYMDKDGEATTQKYGYNARGQHDVHKGNQLPHGHVWTQPHSVLQYWPAPAVLMGMT